MNKKKTDIKEISNVPADFYFESGLMVMTKEYHLKRGFCCGNKCRHCPFEYANVPKSKK